MATPPSELPKLTDALKEADVALGSRIQPDGSDMRATQPAVSALPRAAVFHLLASIWVVGDVKDTQCGFKGFTREAAQDLFARQKVTSIVFDVELIHLARTRAATGSRSCRSAGRTCAARACARARGSPSRSRGTCSGSRSCTDRSAGGDDRAGRRQSRPPAGPSVRVAYALALVGRGGVGGADHPRRRRRTARSASTTGPTTSRSTGCSPASRCTTQMPRRPARSGCSSIRRRSRCSSCRSPSSRIESACRGVDGPPRPSASVAAIALLPVLGARSLGRAAARGAVVAARVRDQARPGRPDAAAALRRSAGAGWTGRGRSGVAAALGTVIKVQPALLIGWALVTGRRRAALIGRCGRGGPCRSSRRSSPGRRRGSTRRRCSAVSASRSSPRNAFGFGRLAYEAGVVGVAGDAHPLGESRARRARRGRGRRVRGSAVASYLAVVIASQFVSPVLWDHYALILLLPAAWLLAARPVVGGRWSRSRPRPSWSASARPSPTRSRSGSRSSRSRSRASGARDRRASPTVEGIATTRARRPPRTARVEPPARLPRPRARLIIAVPLSGSRRLAAFYWWQLTTRLRRSRATSTPTGRPTRTTSIPPAETTLHKDAYLYSPASSWSSAGGATSRSRCSRRSGGRSCWSSSSGSPGPLTLFVLFLVPGRVRDQRRQHPDPAGRRDRARRSAAAALAGGVGIRAAHQGHARESACSGSPLRREWRGSAVALGVTAVIAARDVRDLAGSLVRLDRRC